MAIQNICAKLGVEVSALATINPQSLDISKLNRAELKELSQAILKAKGVEPEVVIEKGDINSDYVIGDVFSSVYFPDFGKVYGTPAEGDNKAQLMVALIPQIEEWYTEGDAFDKPLPKYAKGDWEDFTSDGKLVSVWDQVVAKIQEFQWKLAADVDINYIEKKVAGRKKGTTRSAFVLPVSVKDFLGSISATVKDPVFGDYTVGLEEILVEMRGHMSKAGTLMVKVDSATRRVSFYKKHSSRMGTDIIC